MRSDRGFSGKSVIGCAAATTSQRRNIAASAFVNSVAHSEIKWESAGAIARCAGAPSLGLMRLTRGVSDVPRKRRPIEKLSFLVVVSDQDNFFARAIFSLIERDSISLKSGVRAISMTTVGNSGRLAGDDHDDAVVADPAG
jgi:hypothetical protein